MIYTSYYGNPYLKSVPWEKLISISRGSPKDYCLPKIWELAPTKEILNEWKRSHDVSAYIKAYCSDVLKPLTPHIKTLARELDGKVLLCYERPGIDTFCHRLIVIKWLLKNGILAAEMGWPK